MLSEVKSFGSFRLDTANHCLWRDAERVSITPKAYDVLCYLVENSGRLVKPDEMLEAIWADTYVNPEVLRKYILEIRKALGDKTDAPQFVETVPKRGYRFIAPVRADSELSGSDAIYANTSSTDATNLTTQGKFGEVDRLLAPGVPTKAMSRRMGWMVTSLVALMVTLLAVTGYFYHQRTAKAL